MRMEGNEERRHDADGGGTVGACGGSYESEESAGAKKVQLTRRRKLRVHALARYALQAQPRADEAERSERERVRPCGVAADLRDVPLAALPRAERGGHGEERYGEQHGRTEWDGRARHPPLLKIGTHMPAFGMPRSAGGRSRSSSKSTIVYLSVLALHKDERSVLLGRAGVERRARGQNCGRSCAPNLCQKWRKAQNTNTAKDVAA